jgi:hypothetical protein
LLAAVTGPSFLGVPGLARASAVPASTASVKVAAENVRYGPVLGRDGRHDDRRDE